MTRRPLDPADEGEGEVVFEAPGVDEVAVFPWPLVIRRRLAALAARERSSWVVLGVALAGLFAVGFAVTLLAVSLPGIADDLGSSESTLTWVITGPMLAFGVAGPALGKAGDLWGHRRLFCVGMAGAALFAALVALAWDAGSLIAFRVLAAGMGSATGPASLAIINSRFRGDDRVKALGWWSMVGAGAPVLGVVVGGPVIEAFGWRWLFVAQVPLCLAAFALGLAVLPETERSARVSFDWPGTACLALGVTSLLFALNRGQPWGWASPVVVGGFVVAPLGLVGFLAAERRTPDPLIPLGYFRRRNFAAAIGSQFFSNFAYMGGFILTPILLQDVLGYGETRTGLLVMSRPLAFAVIGPLAGYLTVRVGERSAAVGGGVLVVGSMLMLAAIGPGTGDGWIVAALALSGFGLGAAAPAMAAVVAEEVDPEHYGVAGATQQLIVQVGVLSGIQIMQTVQASTERSAGPVESYGRAYLVGAAVALVGVGVSARVRRIDRRRAR